MFNDPIGRADTFHQNIFLRNMLIDFFQNRGTEPALQGMFFQRNQTFG